MKRRVEVLFPNLVFLLHPLLLHFLLRVTSYLMAVMAQNMVRIIVLKLIVIAIALIKLKIKTCQVLRGTGVGMQTQFLGPQIEKRVWVVIIIQIESVCEVGAEVPQAAVAGETSREGTGREEVMTLLIRV